jgi:PD-(D/E)XK nuclease superfamily protein
VRAHHTKNKGDLGVLHAQLDLALRGYAVLLPLTEHAAFDLVAYRAGRFLRVQVKYRAARDGVISVPLSTCWADRHGVHTVPIDRDEVDLFCIYCPDTDRCYYVDTRTCPPTVRLRIGEPRNAQRKGIRWARDHEDLPASLRDVPPGCSLALEGRAAMRHSRARERPVRYAPIAQLDRARDF